MAGECIVTSVWHMAWEVAVATSLHRRKDVPKASYRLTGSHLHGMPLRRHGPSRKTEVACSRTSSLELHHSLVHRHVVIELVLIEGELRASCWPVVIELVLGDGDEELDKPLGHVREHSSLTAAASHLQK